jgi:hypothetical protein
MPAGYTYLAEAAGGRIIRMNVGLGQVGDPYQLEVYPWDERPLGDDGEVIFRWLTVLVRHTMGYNLGVTPVVDGVALQATNFSTGPIPAGQLEDVARLRLWPMKRGNRISAIIKTVALLGPTELVDVIYGFAPIRTGR